MTCLRVAPRGILATTLLAGMRRRPERVCLVLGLATSGTTVPMQNEMPQLVCGIHAAVLNRLRGVREYGTDPRQKENASTSEPSASENTRTP